MGVGFKLERTVNVMGTNVNKLMLCMVLAACGGGEANSLVDQAGQAGQEADALIGPTCDYPQLEGTAKHTGLVCPGVKGMHVAQVIVQDPDADAENAFSGFLQIHESAALTKGNMVVVPGHSGFGGDGFDRTHDVWNLQAFRWSPSVTAANAKLLPAWKATSTWKPVDALFGSSGFGTYTNGYVMGFYPLIANNSVYQPAAAGTLQRINLATGAVVSTIDPLKGTSFDGDGQTSVVNALTADVHGNLYYAITAFPPSGNRSDEPRGSWIAIVHPDDSTTLLDWVDLAQRAGIPGLDDPCEYSFGTAGTPAPTGPDSLAPLFGCGVTRPVFNAPISVDDNGDFVVMTSANNSRATFLVKVSGATKSALWVADTRKNLTYGCGVRLDATTFDNCPVLTNNGTTNLGVDPSYNLPIHWTSTDIMDNAPTIAPNGDISIGSYDNGFTFEGIGGFDARGSALLFNSAGQFVGKNEAYGWEVTPTVIPHADGTFSYAGDHNLYSLFDLSVATYDSRFKVQTQGAIPIDFNAIAIDWLDANIAADTDGSYYGVNGEGVAVKFDSTGKQVDQVVLPNFDGTGQRSMETEAGYASRDAAGRLYLSYAGAVYVVDSSGTLNPQPMPRAASPRLTNGLHAKMAGTAGLSLVPPPAARP